MTRWYSLLRSLHLYFGLFLSPFVVLFAVSVFFLVHGWLPTPKTEAGRVVSELKLSSDLEKLSGRALIDALKPVLEGIQVHGEVGWVSHDANGHRFTIPVTIPGRVMTVTLDLPKREASIESRTTGWADAAVMLHKMPGPHLVGMRGNWGFIQIWRWFADATVYLLILVPLSGVYLWYASRIERRAGLAWLVAGGTCFAGVIYALVC